MAILLKNIKQLLQVREATVDKVSGKDMKHLPKIDNAFLLMENGVISDFGPMSQLPESKSFEEIDCTDRFVLPSWCDSHTHIVYAGNREQEFVDRINGLSYEEYDNDEKDNGALDAHWGAEVTYDFWQDIFNRNSFVTWRNRL